MPTGRGKKAAKSAPLAPNEQAVCPDMEDFLGDSDIEDSQGITPKSFSIFISCLVCVAVSESTSRKRKHEQGPGVG